MECKNSCLEFDGESVFSSIIQWIYTHNANNNYSQVLHWCSPRWRGYARCSSVLVICVLTLNLHMKFTLDWRWTRTSEVSASLKMRNASTINLGHIYIYTWQLFAIQEISISSSSKLTWLYVCTNARGTLIIYNPISITLLELMEWIIYNLVSASGRWPCRRMLRSGRLSR